jgi:SAM-dependent methyltransferase
VSLAPLSASAEARHAGMSLPLFALALFVSACLLFAVQPMFTRMVLPTLGGAPAVWSVAMVFFQAMLLAGYAYAHVLARALTAGRALGVHLAVMALALSFLPIALTQALGAPPADGASLWLIGVFLVSIGLPFFAVAANAPLLQAWFAKTDHPHAKDPYFLYGASNLGSFAALIAYPWIIEPLLGLGAQSRAWTGGFLVLAALVAACGLVAARAPAKTAAQQAEADAPAPSWREAATWVGLAFVPSALLVAVTAHISSDIAAAPFLWVLPLALFLLTFVVVFQPKPVLPHRLMVMVQPILVALLIGAIYGGLQLHAAALTILNLAAFFVAAMVAHGELARRRPPAIHLTAFYLFMSLGGVLGGIFSALIAPVLFDTVAEYPILIVAALAIGASSSSSTRASVRRDLALGVGAGLAIAALRYPFAFTGLQLALALTAGLTSLLVLAWAWRSAPLRVAGLVAVLFLAEAFLAPTHRAADSVRSFFGVHRVVDMEDGRFRLLFHGTTLHGAMRLRDNAGAPVSAPEPTTYYHPAGPFGDVIRLTQHERPAARVAAVGLGTGSLAWYARRGDAWTFYEIDSTVVALARDPNRFRFLANAPAIPIVVGDARLTLAGVPDGSLDLLVVDAFSSDAIPVHLLTTEALRLYARKLVPGGRILLHISNRNLELASVVAAAAEASGLRGVVRMDRPSEGLLENFRSPTHVVVLAPADEALSPLRAQPGWTALAARPDVAAWTDDFADIPAALWRRWVRGE